MSRRKKQLYGTLLGCGALAMLVDRLLPATVVADAPVPGQSAAAVAATESGPKTSWKPAGGDFGIPELPFPRVSPWDGAGLPIRNLFKPPRMVGGEWTTGSEPDDPQGGVGGRRRTRTVSAAVFARRHRLLGLLVRDELRIAIIDGKWVREGEEIDGCTLNRITDVEAHFECMENDVILTMFDRKDAEASRSP